jgi:uncharacterized membrane protein
LQLIYDLLRQKGVEIKIQRDMKQFLIAIAMVLTLSMNAEAVAQNHRHTPRTEQVDSTQNNHDAIEAFSDTTGVASSNDSTDYVSRRRVYVDTDEDVNGIFHEVFGEVGHEAIGWMIFALVLIFIMFVLAPVLIIIAVFYFVNKNRKERIKLAQMAMEKGQPIPDELLKDRVAQIDDDEYQKGLRQMFTGIGLAIFLGIVAGKVGFGIGALVFFIGLGKWFISRQSRNMGNDSQGNQSSSNINNNVNNTEL